MLHTHASFSPPLFDFKPKCCVAAAMTNHCGKRKHAWHCARAALLAARPCSCGVCSVTRLSSLVPWGDHTAGKGREVGCSLVNQRVCIQGTVCVTLLEQHGWAHQRRGQFQQHWRIYKPTQRSGYFRCSRSLTSIINYSMTSTGHYIGLLSHIILKHTTLLKGRVQIPIYHRSIWCNPSLSI